METELSADYSESQEREIRAAFKNETELNLDLTHTYLEVDVENIAQYENEDYALLRKNGLGASDSSVVLGVNPFKNQEQLIAEKVVPGLSDEEKAVGDKLAVRKGRDLEPLIIEKFTKFFNQPTTKPTDMYRFKEYPFLKVNYDGVTKAFDTDGINFTYIPAEIKVVTSYGEKHYQPEKAFFKEGIGFCPMPLDVSDRNWDIYTKAAHYGIPPYYYTQLQQEMMGLNAPFGHLSVLFEKSWKFYSFLVYKDQVVQNEIILQGYKLWERIEAGRALGATSYAFKERTDAIVKNMKEKHINFAMADNITPVKPFMKGGE